MSKRLDLTGTKRGRLTFISFSHIENQSTYWNCKCDCGNICVIKGSGYTKSCGCLSIEAKSKNGKKNKNRQSHKDFIVSRIKIDQKTGCWNWTKSLIKGYARISGRRGKESQLASRYVFKYIKGIDPKDKQVCHTCDNPKCVNPDHLFLGTLKDNFQDMKNKGRSARGVKNSKAKLTESEVKKIRSLKGKLTGVKTAELFDVSHSTIKRIWSGKLWTHI
jgi:hypothetical protein